MQKANKVKHSLKKLLTKIDANKQGLVNLEAFF